MRLDQERESELSWLALALAILPPCFAPSDWMSSRWNPTGHWLRLQRRPALKRRVGNWKWDGPRVRHMTSFFSTELSKKFRPRSSSSFAKEGVLRAPSWSAACLAWLLEWLPAAR